VRIAHIRRTGYYTQYTLCYEPAPYTLPCADDSVLCKECMEVRVRSAKGWDNYGFGRPKKLWRWKPVRPEAPKPEFIKDGEIPKETKNE
jgi:hypothetical protein